jgi:glycosyltransferase 2 family protein
MKKTLKYVIFIAISAGLMWVAFKDIPIQALLDKFKRTDYRWLWASLALTFVAHWGRAMRWQMLLKLLGYQPSALNANLAVWTGYFSNYIVPRMGEVTRCGTLQKTDGIPFDKSFGTVVAERVFDVVTMLLLVGITFVLEFDRLSTFFIEFFKTKLPSSNRFWMLLGIVLLVLLAGVATLLIRSVRERILQNALVAKIIKLGQGLLEGLLIIRKLENPVLFLAYTVLIWLMYYLSAYLLFFAIPETSQLTWLAGLTLLVVGALGMTAPSQGGIGPYHILVGEAMVLYGLSAEDGKLLATFIHGSQMLLTLVVGGLAFLMVMFIERKN